MLKKNEEAVFALIPFVQMVPEIICYPIVSQHKDLWGQVFSHRVVLKLSNSHIERGL